MHSCIFFHVENVATVEQVVEVEETKEGIQEQQQFVELEPVEVQNLESNPESQPDKPQFINPRVLHNFKLTQFSTYAFAFKFIGIV